MGSFELEKSHAKVSLIKIDGALQTGFRNQP